MGEGDLHMHWHGDCVAEQDEREACPVGRDGLVNSEVTEPDPEEKLAGGFKVAEPPCRTLARPLATEDILPA